MNEEELFDRDEERSMMLSESGKCQKCGKVTDAFCDMCNAWICDSHLVKGKDEYECFCQACVEKEQVIVEE